MLSQLLKIIIPLLLFLTGPLYGQEDSLVLFSLKWQGWVTILVLIGLLIALIREWSSPDLTMLVAASCLLIFGVLTPQQFLAGLSRGILFTLAMLFILVQAIEVNGLLAFLAERLLPKKGGYRTRLFRLMAPTSAISAFFNNTPLVLLLTGVIRRWAVDCKESPSKYLMPVSFAAIFGGMCTLIGTAPNLVVDGLLRAIDVRAHFSFFELGLVGLPALLLAYLYLFTFGIYFLPTRKEPTERIQEEAREFICEFEVGERCPWIGHSLEEIGKKYLEGKAFLIEIHRGDHLLTSPSPTEKIEHGDHLVFVAGIDEFAQIAAIRGLHSLAESKYKLETTSPHFSEAVVAMNSYLVGRSIRHVAFRSHYGASVIAIYRNGQRLMSPVGESLLRAGDTLLLISDRPWELQGARKRDLYRIATSREVPLFLPKKAIAITLILIGMVIAVTLGLPILYGSTAAVALLLIGRLITFRQARRGINWQLLLLVAAAFPLGTALYATGVADLIAHGVLWVVGTQPHFLILGISVVTILLTELITNVAAALVIFPIAFEVIRIAGYDTTTAIKAIGVTIAISASSSFLTPIGYQTNMIVYGPGGYRFTDYARVGWGLTLIQILLLTFLVPEVWPLTQIAT